MFFECFGLCYRIATHNIHEVIFGEILRFGPPSIFDPLKSNIGICTYSLLRIHLRENQVKGIIELCP